MQNMRPSSWYALGALAGPVPRKAISSSKRKGISIGTTKLDGEMRQLKKLLPTAKG